MSTATRLSIALAFASLVCSTTQSFGAEGSEAGDKQVPLFLSGIILKAPDTSTCNQGNVKYLIKHFDHVSNKIVETRLEANNKPTENFLSKVVGKRTRVVVAGYFHKGVEGPQCGYLAAYYAGLEDEMVQELEKKGAKEQ